VVQKEKGKKERKKERKRRKGMIRQERSELRVGARRRADREQTTQTEDGADSANSVL
jgi:hypothetical protein